MGKCKYGHEFATQPTLHSTFVLLHYPVVSSRGSDSLLAPFRDDKLVPNVEKIAREPVGFFEGIDGDPILDRNPIQRIAGFHDVLNRRSRWSRRLGCRRLGGRRAARTSGSGWRGKASRRGQIGSGLHFWG